MWKQFGSQIYYWNCLLESGLWCVLNPWLFSCVIHTTCCMYGYELYIYTYIYTHMFSLDMWWYSTCTHKTTVSMAVPMYLFTCSLWKLDEAATSPHHFPPPAPKAPAATALAMRRQRHGTRLEDCMANGQSLENLYNSHVIFHEEALQPLHLHLMACQAVAKK